MLLPTAPASLPCWSWPACLLLYYVINFIAAGVVFYYKIDYLLLNYGTCKFINTSRTDSAIYKGWFSNFIALEN